MKNTIHIQKSINEERLIETRSIAEKISEYFLLGMLILVFPAITLNDFFFKNSNIISNELQSIELILSIVFSSLLIYALSTRNKLYRINGISREQNQILIEKFATENKMKLSINKKDLIIFNLHWENSSGFDWGKQVTVFFDDSDLLVNCKSFGIHGINSPFHWIANKRMIKKLKRKF